MLQVLPDLLIIQKFYISMMICLKGRLKEAHVFSTILKSTLDMNNFEGGSGVPSKQKATSVYDSMTTQTICICLWYDTSLTFKLLEANSCSHLLM